MTSQSNAPAGEFFANGAERHAFERFRDELAPLGWTIAHNLYVSRRDERGARARELDLLLLHPRHGVVLVEVKGGSIERQVDGTWRQNGKSMRRQPDQQAGSATFEFREALRDNPRWTALGIQVTTGWLLCVPQADASSIALSRIDGSVNLAADQIVDRVCLSRPGGVAEQVGRFVARTHARNATDPAPDFDWVPLALEILSPAFGF